MSHYLLGLLTALLVADHLDAKLVDKVHRSSNDFQQILNTFSDSTKSVAVAYTDSGYLEFACNWVSSLRKHSVDNYFILAGDRNTYDRLIEFGANVIFPVGERKSESGASWFDTREFHDLVSVRWELAREVIHSGFNVFLSDVDSAWSANPFTSVLSLQSDVESLVDAPFGVALPPFENVFLAVGFSYFKSGAKMEWMFDTVSEMIKTQDVMEQSAMNSILNYYWSASIPRPSVRGLDPLQVPNGYVQFVRRAIDVERANGNDIKVVAAQPNWGIGPYLKRYRLRRELMWDPAVTPSHYNTNGQLFLTYTHPQRDKGIHSDLKHLHKAIALSLMTGRTVILPPFYCYGSADVECGWDTILDINALEKFITYKEDNWLKEPSVKRQFSASDAVTISLGDIGTRNSGEAEKNGLSEWPFIRRGYANVELGRQLETRLRQLEDKLLIISDIDKLTPGFSDAESNKNAVSTSFAAVQPNHIIVNYRDNVRKYAAFIKKADVESWRGIVGCVEWPRKVNTDSFIDRLKTFIVEPSSQPLSCGDELKGTHDGRSTVIFISRAHAFGVSEADKQMIDFALEARNISVMTSQDIYHEGLDGLNEGTMIRGKKRQHKFVVSVDMAMCRSADWFAGDLRKSGFARHVCQERTLDKGKCSCAHLPD